VKIVVFRWGNTIMEGKQSYAKTNMLGAGNKEFILIGG
jgi:hypothetical protein